jgi:N6-L-threonylcarbamoyladenine synthase
MKTDPEGIVTLAIETSCDDTAVAVLRNREVLSNVVASQILDKKFGGVVPELASRQHIRQIIPVIRHAIEQADTVLQNIDQIAVTFGPGLVGSLLVGLNTAQAMSYGLDVPLIPVNHIEAHLLAVFLEHESVEWPAIALIVSGGHTILVEVQEIGRYRLIGETQDDAAGECFDKVARALGLLQSANLTMGGPVIESQSLPGNPEIYHFPRPMLKSNDDHFSFSGLKTAMIQFIQSHTPEYIQNHMADVCAGFQEAVVDVLVSKSIKACQRTQSRSLIIAGGVAANSRLRTKLQSAALPLSIMLYSPSMVYCTDNAAMTGITAYLRRERFGIPTGQIVPNPNLRISE